MGINRPRTRLARAGKLPPSYALCPDWQPGTLPSSHPTGQPAGLAQPGPEPGADVLPYPNCPPPPPTAGARPHLLAGQRPGCLLPEPYCGPGARHQAGALQLQPQGRPGAHREVGGSRPPACLPSPCVLLGCSCPPACLPAAPRCAAGLQLAGRSAGALGGCSTMPPARPSGRAAPPPSACSSARAPPAAAPPAPLFPLQPRSPPPPPGPITTTHMPLAPLPPTPQHTQQGLRLLQPHARHHHGAQPQHAGQRRPPDLPLRGHRAAALQARRAQGQAAFLRRRRAPQ
jgi:hypothetical protein